MPRTAPIFNWQDWVGVTPLVSGFALQRLEHLIPPDLRLIAPHRFDFYTIAWVTNGRGVHTVDFASYRLEPQTLFFTSPGQIYSCIPSSSPAGYVVHFSAEFLLTHGDSSDLLYALPFFHLINGDPFIPVREADQPLLHHLFEQLERESQTTAFGNQALISLYLRALLIQIQRLGGEEEAQAPTRASTRLVKQFQMLIEQQFLQTTRLADYADQLGVTAKHLSETIKQETGKTASALLHDRLVLEAKRLLKHSDLTISAIANHLGFEDQAYFWRFFRRHTQQSPGTFRTTHP